MTGAGRAGVGGLVAAALFLLTGAAIVQLNAAVAQRAALTSGAYRQLALGDARPLAPAAVIAEALGRAPLDQRLLNMWTVADWGESGANPQTLALLEQGGFRDTPTAVNLMFAAAARDDGATLARQLDGLIRREEAPAQTLAILAALELDQQARGKVVDLLAAHPSWRGKYLAASEPLAKAGGIAARLDVLQRLAQRGGVARWEAQFASQKALLAGDEARALAFWHLARDLPAGDGQPFPFEWTVNGSAALDGRVVRDAGESLVEINWNGFGRPVLARRFVATATPGAEGVTLRGLTGLAPQDVEMRVRCRNGGWMTMRRDIAGPMLHFTAPARLACPLAEQMVLAARSPNTPVALGFRVAGDGR